ncbi:helix-turn-helix domain-containing protein [Cytobacillus praedii]|uniref:helix-turn-helix domain-containing protein n=1 Tax=Cytobacillus praedii TaxID=1742358 RepID=UPI001F618F0C|nr:helix-turn-helix transcriptional regulator [Cytobacillus praedii]
MSSLGNRIKSLRKTKKLTQKEFGDIFKLGESTISMYERDERKPDYEILQKIADYFEVTTDFY